MSRIIITHYPIAANKEEVFEMVKYDEKLIEAINNYSNDLEKKNIEVFENKGNIIATERGYYFAFYDYELAKA